jgi:hypothetical protein
MKSRSEALLAVPFLLLSFACHDDTSPTQPQQSSLAGNYLLTARESCSGAVSNAQVPVEQSGDQIDFLLGVDTGSFLGKVHGNTIDVTWSKQSDAGLICGSDLNGTAMIQGGTITGSVSGNANGRSCFTCASDTITFTLVRQR